jgi:hypothetical protein
MMKKKGILKILVLTLFLSGWGEASFQPSPAHGGTLAFSKPEHLATIPWSDGSNHGVPSSGPEWLVVDGHGRFYLESGLDFDLYAPNGKYLKTLNPIDKTKNFYGFTAMEPLPGGAIALLTRLESPQEQWGKDDYEEHTKPGSRLIVLKDDGQVQVDKEVVDPDQPHSNYYLENGVVYSVRDDGTYQILDSLGPGSPKDHNFSNFADIGFSLDRWLDHLKKLPVFESGDKSYHDTKGTLHEIKGAASSLMGRPFVEGLGPLAERNGTIYYQVVCDKNQDFINSIFVEDTKRKAYGLVELFHSDEDLDMAHGHAVFVNSKGDIFEGVGKKEGYRIYEWKRQ